jgi:CBS domain containing-hemolysin-like protein
MPADILLIIFLLALHAFFIALQCPVTGKTKPKGARLSKQGLFDKIATFISGDEPTFSAAMQAAAIVSFAAAGVLVYEFPLLFNSGFLNTVAVVLVIKIIVTFIAAVIIYSFMPDVRKYIEPGTASGFVVLPAYTVYLILYPLAWIMKTFVFLVYRIRYGKTNHFLRHIVFSDNLASVMKKAPQTGVADLSGKAGDDLKLLKNAIEFTNAKVRDSMIPRPEIVAADVNSRQEEIMQKFVDTGFSKILIYEESVDNILGYITSKELFGRPGSVKSLLHPIFFVTETMPASRLLKKFIQEKKGISIVVDEFGLISGLITIEDLIEEIFGEIEDEHDVDQFIEKKTGDNEYVLSGRLETDYLNERYGLGIPEDEAYSTLAGFILHNYGSIPRINDVITIGSFTIKIIKVSRNRVDLVRFKAEK